MDRRDFLEGAGGLAALGAAGCNNLVGGLLTTPAVPTDVDMGAFLKRLDGAMAAIVEPPPGFGSALGRVLPASAVDGVTASGLRKVELVRESLRSLLLVGSFRDLPEKAQVHPGMQLRIRHAMPELDASTRGMRDALEDMSPTELHDVGRALRKDDALGPRILAALDDEAAAIGVMPERRAQMLRMGHDVCFRLRQSAPGLIDEYGKKMRKLERLDRSNRAAEQRIAARMGPDFLGWRAEIEEHVRSWNVASGGDPVAPPAGAQVVTASDPPSDDRGDTVLLAGGIILGLGALVLAVGGIVLAVGGGLGGAIAMTVGGVVSLAGIITLIVGACL